MTVAADTFADFVDHLTEALDDGAAAATSGEEWAAQLHFSRYQFDRMISAVAGEPPAAFRRRILLERAAYRMISTNAPLIDIAVEAGYGSHEAFTRAFSRAYDASPVTWRRKPGHLQIAAPSGVHFHPAGGLRLSAARGRGRDVPGPRPLRRRRGPPRRHLRRRAVRTAEVFTYGGMIAHVPTFAAHRRTLVVLAFASYGIDDLGWGDPMLWVAEPAAST
jgi:AraC-like DNA-binding protein